MKTKKANNLKGFKENKFMFAKNEFVEMVNEDIKKILPKEKPEVYGMLEEYIFRGGKRVRPLLMYLTYKYCGGKNPKEIVRYGSLIEMFHNFSLIHDDIEDDSEFRRGKPTLHIMYNLPIALNSGDALYTIIWNEMLNIDNKIAKILGNAFKKVVEGQGLELDTIYKNEFDISYEKYYEIVKGKTAALMGASFEVGALLANSKKYKEFKEFGENLGIAFQIWDDILNLEGDFKTYKKEIGGDINEGKRTLMVIYTLKNTKGKERERFLEILQKHPNTKEEIIEAIDIIKKTGGIDFAKKEYEKYVEKINKFLDNLDGDKEELVKITNKIINRNQ